MSDDRYVVEIKPSARRTNGPAGEAVNRRGRRHRFESRDQAETWAAGLSSRGERTVWIRGANPNDAADVDAYLMGRLRPPERGAVEARRPRDSPGDQAGIADYDPDGDRETAADGAGNEG